MRQANRVFQEHLMANGKTMRDFFEPKRMYGVIAAALGAHPLLAK